MKKIILKLTGMHCTSCSVLIDTILEELPGVKRAKTSYADQKTEIDFDPKLTNIDQLIKVVKEEGYSAVAL